MDSSDFRSERSGVVEVIEQGSRPYTAFVPHAPPPTLNFTPELVASLSEADAAIGELAGVGRGLPKPVLLLSPFVRREAVLSSRIEGTQATLDDVLRDEMGVSEGDDDDVREVRNYVTALEYGISQVGGGRTISLDLVRDLHERLVPDVRGVDKHPGEFRTAQNWIGGPGSTPWTAIFVPPPPHRLAAVLEDWERFVLRESHQLPPLVVCGLMHQQFETIHPFRDGNGRVGRLLITLMLIERRRLPVPLLYLSAYIERHKLEYVRLLQAVRTDGAWEAWLTFFLTGVSVTAKEATLRTRAVLETFDEMRNAAVGLRLGSQLLPALLQNPFMTSARAIAVLGVTPPSARAAIDSLVRAGVLTALGREGRTPVFVASALLALWNRPVE